MRLTRAAIVDDDNAVLDLIEQILKEEGLKVVREHQAETLLEILPEKKVDLIISDLVLPGISGLDLLQELHIRGYDIPFVLITGYASLDSAIKAINRGAFYYIKKPFNIDEIRFVISRLRQRQGLLEEIHHLKEEIELLKKRLEGEKENYTSKMPTHSLDHFLRGRYELEKVFSAIEHLGRLKAEGLITDDEFGEYKGRLLKRIA
ncbi:MAG: response regulator [Deltaproteobacteria bacterium]|nr:response regulator [Deltaproteobacteria bacterium]